MPENESLSGNRRAVQTVRSVSIPGVVFAGENNARGTGGRFKVVEPRPVFVRGRLLYLLSVIPENGNSVSKSVFVDAERNKVAAIFDNDTDPSADEKTLRYLQTGDLDQAAVPEEESGSGTSGGQRAAGGGDDAQRQTRTPNAVQRRLERLIRQQRETLRETEELQREIERGR